MATYFITRHAWLQRREDKIGVSNVSTMRRVLLTPDQLAELEQYAQGAELRDRELTLRLLEADLLVREEQQAAENPRQSAIMFAVDKFLAERHGMSRSKLVARHPDPWERLDQVEELVTQQMSALSPRQDRWQRRSGVDDFRALLDHVRTFLREDAPEAGAFLYPAGYLSATAGRPLPRYDYEQQPCMPATTVQRVRHAASNLGESSRGLILGDDDLIGLYWSQLHGRRFRTRRGAYRLPAAAARPSRKHPQARLDARPAGGVSGAVSGGVHRSYVPGRRHGPVYDVRRLRFEPATRGPGLLLHPAGSDPARRAV
jgi:hypothetical protein